MHPKLMQRKRLGGLSLPQILAAKYQWYFLGAAPQADTSQLIDISGNGRNVSVAAGAAVIQEDPERFGNYDAAAFRVEASGTYLAEPAANLDPLNMVSSSDRLAFIVSHERTEIGANAGRFMEMRSGGDHILLHAPTLTTFGIFADAAVSTDWHPAGTGHLYLLGGVHEPSGNDEIWANGHLVKVAASAGDENFSLAPDFAIGADTGGGSRTGGTYNLAGAAVNLSQEQMGAIMSDIMLGRPNFYWDKVHPLRSDLHCYLPGTDPAGTVGLDGSGLENHATYSGVILGQPPVDPRFVRSVYTPSTGDIVIPAYDWTGASWTACGFARTKTSTSRALGCVDTSRASGGDIRFFPVSGRMNFSWHDGTSTLTADTGDGVTLDQPYFWTIRHDFGSSTISVFVDGGKKDTVNISSLTMPSLAAVDMTINESFGLAAGFHDHNGIAVFTRALSDSEILELAS